MPHLDEGHETGLLQRARRGMVRCTFILALGLIGYLLTKSNFGAIAAFAVILLTVLAALKCLSDADKKFVCPKCGRPILRSIREGADWFNTRHQLWELRLLILGPRSPDYCPRCSHRLN